MYLASGERVAVRAWHRRRDRSALERWPRPVLPPHWIQAEPATGERLSFAVDLMCERRLVGRISLRSAAAGTARIGLYVHPEYTSRGYGSEALAIFCGYAFGELGLAALALDVAIDNRRAVRCYETCDFEHTALVQRGGSIYAEMIRYAPGTTVCGRVGVGAVGVGSARGAGGHQ